MQKGGIVMLKSRRGFLRIIGGAGLGIISLPTISTLDSPSTSNFLGSSDDAVGDLEAMLDRLTAAEGVSNPFVAQAAEGEVEVEPQALLSAPAALLNILDRLELSKSFSNRVGYGDAAQCRSNFQSHEASWRDHFGSFTDVERSPADRDVAYLVGGNIDSSNRLVQAQGATQYQGKASVALSGDDPGVVLAAQPLLGIDRTPSRREAAQGLAVIGRRTETVRGDQTATQYETPTSVITHFPNYRPRSSRVGHRSRGVVIAQSKKSSPNRLYYSELYV